MYVHAITSAAALAFLIAASPAAGDTPDASPTIAVHVANFAPAGAPHMQRALRDARHIYRTIGIDIAFIDRDDWTPSAGRSIRQLRLVLLPRAGGAAAPLVDSMGVALLTDGRPLAAYVFFDRVERTAHEHAVAVEAVLATVIAHELGHLLLCSSVHSPAGLMRARWGREELVGASQGQLRFSSDISAVIHRRLDPAVVVVSADHRTIAPAVRRK